MNPYSVVAYPKPDGANYDLEVFRAHLAVVFLFCGRSDGRNFFVAAVMAETMVAAGMAVVTTLLQF